MSAYAYTVTRDGRAVGPASSCTYVRRDGDACGRDAAWYAGDDGPRCHDHMLADVRKH